MPRMVTKSGGYFLNAIETRNDAILLCDPQRGEKEYSLLENRWPGTSCDDPLPDSGVAICTSSRIPPSGRTPVRRA